MPSLNRAAAVGVCLTLACVGAACEEMVSRQYPHDVGDLSRADRIEVTYELRWNPQSGQLEAPPVARISDRQRIAAAAAFVGRYRDGWSTILSGSPAWRHLAFYDGDRLLAVIGVFSEGITHDIQGRLLTIGEVAELVDLLGVPWPSLENPQSPPRPSTTP